MRCLSVLVLVVLTGCGKPDCQALFDERSQISAGFSRGCSADSDCVAVSTPQNCFLDCGAVVLADQQQAFADKIAQFDADHCASTGCHAAAMCAGALIPHCVQGVCQ
ncbi:MAG: hypothetical protein JST54_22330 [Deltaproteobacteria bacterium]|nr:hypothetical protein [Deltaproteobacteria bacterium]